jgi:hypothetical protein
MLCTVPILTSHAMWKRMPNARYFRFPVNGCSKGMEIHSIVRYQSTGQNNEL